MITIKHSIQKLVLKLNIGGTIFQTTYSTLTKYDSMFRTLLVSRDPVELDPSGCIFIDRDPTHFRLILNFMRDGVIELPENLKEVKEILKEAEFYSLEGLAALCQEVLNPKHKFPYRIFKDVSELFEVLMDAKKDILVIEFPFQDAYIPFPFSPSTMKIFIEKHSINYDIYFLASRIPDEMPLEPAFWKWKTHEYPLIRDWRTHRNREIELGNLNFLLEEDARIQMK